jgi:hypothetical protein
MPEELRCYSTKIVQPRRPSTSVKLRAARADLSFDHACGRSYLPCLFGVGHSAAALASVCAVAHKFSAVEKAGFTSLADGAKVSFDVVVNRGKESAENLKIR